MSSIKAKNEELKTLDFHFPNLLEWFSSLV